MSRPLRVRTLAVRLTLWMFVATAIVLLVGIAFGVRAALQTAERELALELTEGVTQFESTFLQPVGGLLALSAGGTLPLEGPACTPALQRLLVDLPQVNVIAVSDANGQLTCSSEGFENLPSVADRPWFQELASGEELVIGAFQVSRSTGEPNVILGAPLEGTPEPHFVGLGIRLGSLSERLAAGTLLSGAAVVVDPSGTVLAHWPDPASAVGMPADEAVIDGVRRAAPGRTFRVPGRTGPTWLYSGREVELANGRFVVATGAPLRVILAPALLTAATQIVALLIAVAVMFVLHHRTLRRSFVAPLERASRFAASLEAQHDGQQLQPPARIAEVRAVYSALNSLSAEIAERLSDLDFVNRVGRSGTWRMDLRSLEVRLSPGAASVLTRDADAASRPTDLDGLLSFVHPENVADVRTRIEWAASGEAQLNATARLRRPVSGDTDRHVTFIGEVRDGRELVAAVADVSSQVRVAKLNERAARYAAAEGMAAGLSHEFNNRLTVVRTNAEILGLQARSKDDASTASAADAILHASEQLSRIMSRILNRVGQRVYDPRDVDLEGAIRDVVKEVEASHRASLDVQAGSDRPAHVDPAWFADALAELLTNAIQATANQDRRVHVVELYGVHLGPSYLALHPDASAGPHHVVSVSDNGVGIPPDDQGRVFEPLFTTKAGSRGYGLGLSNAYAFARRAGGHMELYSEVGIGTTVRMYLPARVAHESAISNAEFEAANPSPGSVSVLLLEDDEDVLAPLEVHLRSQGLRVHPAGSVEEAHRVIDQRDVQAAIVDAVIGGEVAGPAVIDRLRDRHPTAIIVAISGHHPRVFGDDAVHADAFLRKPISAREVTSALKSLLRGGTQRRPDGDR